MYVGFMRHFLGSMAVSELIVNFIWASTLENLSLSFSSLVQSLLPKDTLLRTYWGFANNTGTDQLVHPRSLISAFVIPFLESIIYELATGKISIF